MVDSVLSTLRVRRFVVVTRRMTSLDWWKCCLMTGEDRLEVSRWMGRLMIDDVSWLRFWMRDLTNDQIILGIA